MDDEEEHIFNMLKKIAAFTNLFRFLELETDSKVCHWTYERLIEQTCKVEDDESCY